MTINLSQDSSASAEFKTGHIPNTTQELCSLWLLTWYEYVDLYLHSSLHLHRMMPNSANLSSSELCGWKARRVLFIPFS
jgi:hypothetical protein